ncbi:hypothetical protein [Paludisphaera mucosa]|uniref:Uncharacterized protein n=1 Tax=Paludisphaera mucosa TaxID=3030827 RepID=A0ABT6FF96_9BACT|nr:hypothetical protein [Paludisphaera mucosa]MDG3006169.1 hypothetical protein [Paludisphaera mucosa]
MRLAIVARSAKLVIISLLIAAPPSVGLAQQAKDDPAAAKGKASKPEIISGVIVKAEKVAKEQLPQSKSDKAKADPVLFRLSVNTNAVWRDWVRDQAQVRDEGPAKKDAEKGANSIATKGQPVDENSLVVIEVLATTKIETRFRAPTDETSLGETSPDKVKSEEGAKSTEPPAKKPVRFRAEDLQPGLFVEAEGGKSGTKDEDAAAVITVIRPIRVVEPATRVEPAPKS